MAPEAALTCTGGCSNPQKPQDQGASLLIPWSLTWAQHQPMDESGSYVLPAVFGILQAAHFLYTRALYLCIKEKTPLHPPLICIVSYSSLPRWLISPSSRSLLKPQHCLPSPLSLPGLMGCWAWGTPARPLMASPQYLTGSSPSKS